MGNLFTTDGTTPTAHQPRNPGPIGSDGRPRRSRLLPLAFSGRTAMLRAAPTVIQSDSSADAFSIERLYDPASITPGSSATSTSPSTGRRFHGQRGTRLRQSQQPGTRWSRTAHLRRHEAHRLSWIGCRIGACEAPLAPVLRRGVIVMVEVPARCRRLRC